MTGALKVLLAQVVIAAGRNTWRFLTRRHDKEPAVPPYDWWSELDPRDVDLEFRKIVDYSGPLHQDNPR